MKKPQIIIRQATQEDSEKVVQLRVEQFKSAKEFEILDIQALAIQRGKVYIAQIEDTLISTMQFEIISDLDSLRKLTKTDIPNNFNDFKAMYLSKAATSRDYRNSGLNSYLRYLFLKIAIEDIGINSLIGVAYENAPRLHLLKKIGYLFSDVTDYLDRNFINALGRVYFLTLQRNNFQSAINILEDETKKLFNDFEIILC